MSSWLHTLDPVAFRIPLPGLPPLEVRWYGLAYLLGFYLAFLLLRRWTADPARNCAAADGISRFDPAEFISTAALGVVIGGRLGYALLYDPHLLIGFSARFPFWELLAIWHGGMASHGRLDPAARWEALAAAASAGLCGGGRWGAALPLAGEEGCAHAALVRGGARAAVRCTALGLRLPEGGTRGARR